MHVLNYSSRLRLTLPLCDTHTHASSRTSHLRSPTVQFSNRSDHALALALHGLLHATRRLYTLLLIHRDGNAHGLASRNAYARVRNSLQNSNFFFLDFAIQQSLILTRHGLMHHVCLSHLAYYPNRCSFLPKLSHEPPCRSYTGAVPLHCPTNRTGPDALLAAHALP
ncbi:hypothetical protein BCV70DRAFT_63630 [Testicularia cyperi]|uniref:Uncharacterized protein n=1 Tax=Testicularia cyperi TaxID=1882483 RepID=A0A317XVQ1_9BASI|nr:hypothetical protein BCV70DRAFT_63630 [Testicularia cyperi]